MSNKGTEIIHLYKFDVSSIDETKLKQQIAESLAQYFKGNVPEIHIKGSSNNYSAYF